MTSNGSAGSARRPILKVVDVIARWTDPAPGMSILDVGCGSGALAASLAQRGAAVVGIDPVPSAIEAARRNAPDCTFECAAGESLPFADREFDHVLFSNSLHHVPMDRMGAALGQASRVARRSVVVVEPLAEGPFFAALRVVDDETEVRAAAQRAIVAALENGVLGLLDRLEFDDERRFEGVDALLEKVVAADPGRAEAAFRERSRVEAAMEPYRDAASGLFILPQPHRAHHLVPLST